MASERTGQRRKFGIELVGDIPWGTHLCQIYQTKQDLVDILVPYFAQGLHSNEYCLWITSPPLEVAEATQALRAAVPDLDIYFEKGQIDIVPYSEWYLKGGKFDSERVLHDWVKKEDYALKAGFDGLRLTGNTFWVERELWQSFVDYEETINRVIGKHKMLALCTYCLTRCSGSDILDVVRNHAGTLIKQGEKWGLIEEVAERRKAQASLIRTEQALRENEERLLLKLDSVLSPDVELKEQELSNILDVPALQSMMNDLYAVTKIGFSVIDLKGNVLVSTGWQDICTKFHRVDQRTLKNCLESDLVLTQGVKHGEIRTYKCKNHMYDIVTPLMIGGKHVGNIFSGQFFFDDEQPDRELFAAQAEKYGFEKKAYLEAFDRVPRWSRQTVQELMSFYMKLSEAIAKLSYSNLKVAKSLVDQKQVTEALRESESRLNRSEEIAHLGTWELDLKTNTLRWSDEVYRLFGLAPQEFGATYEAFLSAVHPEDRAAVDAAYSGSLQQGKDSYEIEHRIVRKDGEVRIVHEKAEHIRDSQGKIVRSIGMVHDITERKRAQIALQESEQRWSTTLSSIGDAVISTDEKGKIVFINPVAEKLTGWTLPEASGRPVKEIFNIVNEKTRAEVDNPVYRVLERGIIVGLANHTVLIRKDGHEIPIDDSGAPIRNQMGKLTGVVLVFRDITERKKAEEKLQYSNQRLALISDIANQLLSTTKPQTLIQKLCEEVMTFLNCDVFFNYLVDGQKGQLHLNACAGVGGDTAKTIEWLDFGEAVCGCAAKEGQRIVCENIPETQDPRAALVNSFGVKVYAAHPLFAHGEVIGTLSFGSKQKATFTDDELSLMKIVAAQVSVALERQKAEENLWQAKNDWERTFDSVPDLIAILDHKHKIIRANRAMAQQLGVTTQQTIGQTCYLCVHDSKAPPAFCPHSKTLQDGKEHIAEVHEPRLGGDFIVSSTPLRDQQGRMTGSVHVARNITERKKAEKALQNLNRHLRAISNSNQALMKASDETTFTQEVCNIIVHDCGYALVWVGLAKDDEKKSVVPVAYAGFDEGYIQALNITWSPNSERGHGPTGTAIRTGKRYICKDMTQDSNFKPWIKQATDRGYKACVVLPLTNFEGKTFGVLNIYSYELDRFNEEEIKLLTELSNDFAYGLTILKLRQEKQQADELTHKQASLIDLCPDAIIVKKRQGEILFWSKGAEKLYGWTKKEALGQKTQNLLKPKFSTSLKEIQTELESTGKWTGELLHQTKNGQKLVVQSYWLAKLDQNGNIEEIMETNVDITDRKEMQNKLEEYAAHLEELVQERTQELKDAERLTAIGETADMVGHDLRNPLQTVTGETFLARAELEDLPDSPAKKNLNESINTIAEQISYMNKIVSDLQDFVKPISPEKKDTDLSKLIVDTLKDVPIPSNVQAQVVLQENLPTVLADGQLLRRVLCNLFNNAVQAMPAGGQLTIKTQLKRKNFHENTVVIIVQDTGDGIPQNIRPKIFKPLFTTKSKGQGFGLAVCKRVIEVHGGVIWFESEVGKGTRFFVELPTK